ncbi:MAG: hypothetical protein PWP45_935 [Tepidanaerobacteraceae bacterium]|nr:hypothetical protein [Tepidanaerobacteraceae bacterium]
MLHLQLYFERFCRKCKKRISVLVHDYGAINSIDEADQKLGNLNIPVLPIKCTQCGGEDWPEYALAHDATKNVTFQRIAIGTEDLPIVGGSAPYAHIRSPEKQAELERGLAKLKDYFSEEEGKFWDEYCRWAVERWNEALKWLADIEWRKAYKELGIDIGANSSPAAYRKDAEKRFTTQEEKEKFWRTANSHLVYFELLWVPIDSWPIEEYVRLYGRERITWLLLNLPLPEELERYRTEKLATVIPKKSSGPQAALWERIKQLGEELTKQRRRAENLAKRLAEERAEKTRLEEELHLLQSEIERLKSEAPSSFPVRNIDDVVKIKRLKSLIHELREEVARLNRRREELGASEYSDIEQDREADNVRTDSNAAKVELKTENILENRFGAGTLGGSEIRGGSKNREWWNAQSKTP